MLTSGVVTPAFATPQSGTITPTPAYPPNLPAPPGIAFPFIPTSTTEHITAEQEILAILKGHHRPLPPNEAKVEPGILSAPLPTTATSSTDFKSAKKSKLSTPATPLQKNIASSPPSAKHSITSSPASIPSTPSRTVIPGLVINSNGPITPTPEKLSRRQRKKLEQEQLKNEYMKSRQDINTILQLRGNISDKVQPNDENEEYDGRELDPESSRTKNREAPKRTDLVSTSSPVKATLPIGNKKVKEPLSNKEKGKDSEDGKVPALASMSTEKEVAGSYTAVKRKETLSTSTPTKKKESAPVTPAKKKQTTPASSLMSKEEDEAEVNEESLSTTSAAPVTKEETLLPLGPTKNEPSKKKENVQVTPKKVLEKVPVTLKKLEVSAVPEKKEVLAPRSANKEDSTETRSVTGKSDLLSPSSPKQQDSENQALPAPIFVTEKSVALHNAIEPQGVHILSNGTTTQDNSHPYDLIDAFSELYNEMDLKNHVFFNPDFAPLPIEYDPTADAEALDLDSMESEYLTLESDDNSSLMSLESLSELVDDTSEIANMEIWETHMIRSVKGMHDYFLLDLEEGKQASSKIPVSQAERMLRLCTRETRSWKGVYHMISDQCKSVIDL